MEKSDSITSDFSNMKISYTMGKNQINQENVESTPEEMTFGAVSFGPNIVRDLWNINHNLPRQKNFKWEPNVEFGSGDTTFDPKSGPQSAHSLYVDCGATYFLQQIQAAAATTSGQYQSLLQVHREEHVCFSNDAFNSALHNNGVEFGNNVDYAQILCSYRTIVCQHCLEAVPWCQLPDHMRLKDQVEPEISDFPEFLTGFEINADALGFTYGAGVTVSLWRPFWMHYYDQDFFCNLGYNGHVAWLWVSSPSRQGCDFMAQIILWNDTKPLEVSYLGGVTPFGLDPEHVLLNELCLIVQDGTLRNLITNGRIDVTIKISSAYVSPSSGPSSGEV